MRVAQVSPGLHIAKDGLAGHNPRQVMPTGEGREEVDFDVCDSARGQTLREGPVRCSHVGDVFPGSIGMYDVELALLQRQILNIHRTQIDVVAQPQTGEFSQVRVVHAVVESSPAAFLRARVTPAVLAYWTYRLGRNPSPHRNPMLLSTPTTLPPAALSRMVIGAFPPHPRSKIRSADTGLAVAAVIALTNDANA